MRFSIIIPAYNAEDHIRKALGSVRSQTFKDYELIVVCDSCTDNTESIAREYGARTEAVSYHADGPTRNRGLELAQGEWILFMDDDDWWLHEYVLELLDEKIRENPYADIICFSFIFRHLGYARPVRRLNGQHWIACWSKCYRRDRIGSARFSSTTSGAADVPFFADMFNKGLTVLDWDMPLYYYNYWRGGSISEKQTTDFRGHGELL